MSEEVQEELYKDNKEKLKELEKHSMHSKFVRYIKIRYSNLVADDIEILFLKDNHHKHDTK